MAPAAEDVDAFEDGAEDDDRLQPWDDPVEIDVCAKPCPQSFLIQRLIMSLLDQC